MMKNTIIACLLIFGGSQAVAQSAQAYYEAGLQYLKTKRVTEAIPYLEEAGRHDHLEALFALGSIHYYGRGYEGDFLASIPDREVYGLNNSTRNMEEAYACFYRAAAGGFAEGMIALAVMYELGLALSPDYLEARREYEHYMAHEDVETADKYDAKRLGLVAKLEMLRKRYIKDETIALHHYEQAASIGHPQAMLRVGKFYINGKGADKDEAKAFEWLRQCADLQDPDCTFFMGLFYAAGTQVEKNLPTALEYFKAASQMGQKDAPWAVHQLRPRVEVDEKGQLRDYYGNGQLEQLATYRDGKLHGDFLLYHENGNLWREGKYIDNKREGTWKEYHVNGEVSEMRNYTDGSANGSYQQFYENGQLAEMGQFERGDREGEWKEFHENGNLKSQGTYSSDQKQGEWLYFNEKGRRANKERYENGKIVK
jgi:TPR repeat protein